MQPVQNSDANDISNDAKSNGDHIALQQDSDLSQIAKIMQETNKIIQMMMVTNVGTENFEKARKLIDGVESPVTIEEKEEDEIVLLSAADQCDQMAGYSEYKYSVFTHIHNVNVNHCVAGVLTKMSTECSIFFQIIQILNHQSNTPGTY